MVPHIPAAAGWTAPSCTLAPHWHRPSTTNCRNVGWSQIWRKTAAFGLYKSLLLPGTLESRIVNYSGSHLAQRWREVCCEVNDLEDDIMQEWCLKRGYFHGARLDIPFSASSSVWSKHPLTPTSPQSRHRSGWLRFGQTDASRRCFMSMHSAMTSALMSLKLTASCESKVGAAAAFRWKRRSESVSPPPCT